MRNTLIVFASEHGTVEKCAKELFHQIEGKVDLCDLNKRMLIPDLTRYDTVIIGGSIHLGKIQSVVKDFCINNLDVLVDKHLGLFINCLYSGSKAQKQLNSAFPSQLNEKAVVRDFFGGEINESKLNYFERIITKQIIKQDKLIVKLSKEKITRFVEKLSTTKNTS